MYCASNRESHTVHKVFYANLIFKDLQIGLRHHLRFSLFGRCYIFVYIYQLTLAKSP